MCHSWSAPLQNVSSFELAGTINSLSFKQHDNAYSSIYLTVDGIGKHSIFEK